MLSESERRQFEEIVRHLLADQCAQEPPTMTPPAMTPPTKTPPATAPKARRRLVAWAERRFLHRLDRSELGWLG
jgi:hypothetical protein